MLHIDAIRKQVAENMSPDAPLAIALTNTATRWRCSCAAWRPSSSASRRSRSRCCRARSTSREAQEAAAARRRRALRRRPDDPRAVRLRDRRRPDGRGGYLVCKVIVDADKRVMCGQIFELDREAEFQRHTGECAHRHLDEIRKASPTHRIPIFNEEEWDPELAEHLQKVGRTMLEEGRLTMNRNERAGG
jgi:hypothetical protein